MWATCLEIDTEELNEKTFMNILVLQ
jgi:hypothetical protein